MANSSRFYTFLGIAIVISISVSAIVSAAPSLIVTESLDCSNIVDRDGEGVLNWLGHIRFTVPESTTAEKGWTMTMTFDRTFTGVGVSGIFKLGYIEFSIPKKL